MNNFSEQVLIWIKQSLNLKELPNENENENEFSEKICEALNTIFPNTIKTFLNQKPEINYQHFINACKELGVEINEKKFEKNQNSNLQYQLVNEYALKLQENLQSKKKIRKIDKLRFSGKNNKIQTRKSGQISLEKEERSLFVSENPNPNIMNQENSKEIITVVKQLFASGKAYFDVKITNPNNSTATPAILKIIEKKIDIIFSGGTRFTIENNSKQTTFLLHKIKNQIFKIENVNTVIYVECNNEYQRNIIWKTMLMFQRYSLDILDPYEIDKTILGKDEEIDAIVLSYCAKKHATFSVFCIKLNSKTDNSIIRIEKDNITIKPHSSHSLIIPWKNNSIKTEKEPNSIIRLYFKHIRYFSKKNENFFIHLKNGNSEKNSEKNSENYSFIRIKCYSDVQCDIITKSLNEFNKLDMRANNAEDIFPFEDDMIQIFSQENTQKSTESTQEEKENESKQLLTTEKLKLRKDFTEVKLTLDKENKTMHDIIQTKFLSDFKTNDKIPIVIQPKPLFQPFVYSEILTYKPDHQFFNVHQSFSKILEKGKYKTNVLIQEFASHQGVLEITKEIIHLKSPQYNIISQHSNENRIFIHLLKMNTFVLQFGTPWRRIPLVAPNSFTRDLICNTISKFSQMFLVETFEKENQDPLAKKKDKNGSSLQFGSAISELKKKLTCSIECKSDNNPAKDYDQILYFSHLDYLYSKNHNLKKIHKVLRISSESQSLSSYVYLAKEPYRSQTETEIESEQDSESQSQMDQNETSNSLLSSLNSLETNYKYTDEFGNNLEVIKNNSNENSNKNSNENSNENSNKNSNEKESEDFHFNFCILSSLRAYAGIIQIGFYRDHFTIFFINTQISRYYSPYSKLVFSPFDELDCQFFIDEYSYINFIFPNQETKHLFSSRFKQKKMNSIRNIKKEPVHLTCTILTRSGNANSRIILNFRTFTIKSMENSVKQEYSVFSRIEKKSEKEVNLFIDPGSYFQITFLTVDFCNNFINKFEEAKNIYLGQCFQKNYQIFQVMILANHKAKTSATIILTPGKFTIIFEGFLRAYGLDTEILLNKNNNKILRFILRSSIMIDIEFTDENERDRFLLYYKRICLHPDTKDLPKIEETQKKIFANSKHYNVRFFLQQQTAYVDGQIHLYGDKIHLVPEKMAVIKRPISRCLVSVHFSAICACKIEFPANYEEHIIAFENKNQKDAFLQDIKEEKLKSQKRSYIHPSIQHKNQTEIIQKDLNQNVPIFQYNELENSVLIQNQFSPSNGKQEEVLKDSFQF
ncbi:dual specificity protein kinase pyk3 [Anaeramoeba ignava]|uniref:Dual specificity protein kinase pyk3 n=1 Tax=Anaeramoeba ignava TaxID=1746090 RepID=A0A9Q0LD87_ANAIG|nr:dual specificity protein kinase pyk3 [Anaeramoeba ignava]